MPLLQACPQEGQTVTDIALTIPALHAAYAAGVPVTRIIEQVYDRIAKVGDPAIFITLIPQDEVLAAAEALGPYDPARPLWGVPFARRQPLARPLPTWPMRMPLS
jgi:Asp-tRNA(Asn)/Glu-tRNA(Gln) amidotransferase A subunit family amidase